MNEDFINKFTSSLEENLGADSYALISDNIGDLITQNNLITSGMEKQKNQIENLEKEKSRLIEANAKLLQSIPVGIENKKQDTPDDGQSNFKMRDAFDDKGNFIK